MLFTTLATFLAAASTLSTAFAEPIDQVQARTLVKRATPPIVSPASGANLVPGKSFDFDYLSIGDYGVSAYNVTVMLITSPPTSLTPNPNINLFDGHIFGRYAWDNYPCKRAICVVHVLVLMECVSRSLSD
jgi:hypothetical protein